MRHQNSFIIIIFLVLTLVLGVHSIYGSGFEMKSIDECNKMIEKDPNDANAYAERAKTYLSLKKEDNAIADFTKAIEISKPDNYLLYYECFFGRAMIYKDKGETEKAISDYSSLIAKLTPSNDDIPKWPLIVAGYYNRAELYNNKRDFDRAIADYSEAIKINPDSAGLYSDRAEAYIAKSDFDKAIADYSKAIDIQISSFNKTNEYIDPCCNIRNDKRNSRGVKIIGDIGYRGRARVYIAKGELDKAITDYTNDIEFLSNYLKKNSLDQFLTEERRSTMDVNWSYGDRAKVYYILKDYNKAWADVHKMEELEYSVDQDFIRDLKEASGREK